MMFAIFVFLFFAYRSISLSKEIRLLQINHYQLSRSFKHLLALRVNTKMIYKMLYHLPFVLLLLVSKNQFDLLILTLIIYCYLRFKFYNAGHKKVSLVYTKRIIRLYFMILLVYTCIFVVSLHHVNIVLVAILLMCIDPFIVFLSSLCMYPLESLIKMMYVCIAKYRLKQNKELKCIGMVGSYGKTSTKNIAYAMLSRKYYCLKSEKSFNNLMGNTITIRKYLKNIHDVFIAEMGSDHNGELHRMMRFLKCQYIVLCSIGNQHMETFGTQENIIKEKISPLWDLNKEDIAFLNIDNAYIEKHRYDGIAKKVTYGKHPDADYHLENVRLYEWGSCFTVRFKGVVYEFETSLLGYYNVMNIVASIAVAHTMEVSMEDIKEVVFRLMPIEHRLQSIHKSHYTLIDNGYNSNVDSFKNSLSILRDIKKYCIFITPGLIDLKDDAAINNALMDYVASSVDEMVIVGYRNRDALVEGLKRNHFYAYQCMDTMEEALAYLDTIEKEDFVALIENDIDKDLMNY